MPTPLSITILFLLFSGVIANSQYTTDVKASLFMNRLFYEHQDTNAGNRKDSSFVCQPYLSVLRKSHFDIV